MSLSMVERDILYEASRAVMEQEETSQIASFPS
jgi:hypothetical protein